jgi:hypothetical protein
LPENDELRSRISTSRRRSRRRWSDAEGARAAEQFVRIVDIQLDRLRRRILDQRIELEVTKWFLAEAGYIPSTVPGRSNGPSGGRSRPRSRAGLVSDEIERGRELAVDLSDGELRFLTARPEMAVAS